MLRRSPQRPPEQRDDRPLIALLAAFAVSAAVAVAGTVALAACGGNTPRAETTPAPAPPAPRSAPTTPAAPSLSPTERKKYAGEDEERPPGTREQRLARRVARRFMADWLAFLAGRVPVSRLRGASTQLRDALAGMSGRQPPGVAKPAAKLTALQRQRPRNPRVLIATFQMRGGAYRRANAELAWAQGRWRVVDLRLEERPRRLLEQLPYEDDQVRIIEGGASEDRTPILLVIPKRGSGEQAIRYTERLIARAGDTPASYAIRFGGE